MYIRCIYTYMCVHHAYICIIRAYTLQIRVMYIYMLYIFAVMYMCIYIYIYAVYMHIQGVPQKYSSRFECPLLIYISFLFQLQITLNNGKRKLKVMSFNLSH